MIRIHKHRLKTGIIAFLCFYMLYLPFLGGNANNSICLFVLSIIGVIFLVKRSRLFFSYKETRIFTLLCLSLVPPLFYSINIKAGILCTEKNLISTLFIAAGMVLGFVDTDDSFLKYLVLFPLPLALCNIIFVINPKLENSFYYGSIAKIIVAPSNIADYFVSNCRDINKAGTLFTNTNNASVFYIIMLSVALILYLNNRKTTYIVITFLYFFADMATGCRTAILVIFSIILWFLFCNKKSILRIVLLALTIVPIFLYIIYNLHFSPIDNIIRRLSIDSLMRDPRIILWTHAIKHLSIFGKGFGGWEQVASLLPIGLSHFPPHNHLLILMYYGGIIPAILYLLLWFLLMNRGIQSWRAFKSIYGQIMACISINIFLHGLFDNYFLHNMNIMSILFVLIGYILVSNDKYIAKVDSNA